MHAQPTKSHIRTNNRNTRITVAPMTKNTEYHCEVCGKEISKEEYESCGGLCWECWDDQMTEECEFEDDII